MERGTDAEYFAVTLTLSQGGTIDMPTERGTSLERVVASVFSAALFYLLAMDLPHQPRPLWQRGEVRIPKRFFLWGFSRTTPYVSVGIGFPFFSQTYPLRSPTLANSTYAVHT